MTTERPLNFCRDCGDTWYPRGRDLSHHCPYCKSTDVEIVEEEASWGLLGVILWAILLTIGFTGLTLVTSPLPDISPNGSYLEELHQ